MTCTFAFLYPLQRQKPCFLRKQLSSSSLAAQTASHESLSTPLNNSTASSSIVDAAAQVTASKCKLLGVKSICVDYGLVRTGIAVTVGYEPTPLAIVAESNITQLCIQIATICKAEDASQIVLGLPVHANGTVAEQTLLTKQFAQVLLSTICEYCGPNTVPIYFWDERYSSKEAASRMSYKLHKQELDSYAACIILEHFYAANGQNAEQVVFTSEQQKETVNQAWLTRQRLNNQINLAKIQEGEHKLNARQLAMDRSKELQEQLINSGIVKKKKKKKKKKRGGVKRIVLA